MSFVLALFYSSQTRYEGIRVLIGFVVLFSIKLRELLTGDPTDPFKELQAATWSILAGNCHQECEQSQWKEVEANEQKEEVKSDEQREDVQSGLQEEVQSDIQRDIQSDEQNEGKGDCGNIQSEEQGKEDEEFAEGSGAENEFGKTEDLQHSVGCRRRETKKVVSSVECSNGSSPEDGKDADETSE